jgi:hypothetical protein
VPIEKGKGTRGNQADRAVEDTTMSRIDDELHSHVTHGARLSHEFVEDGRLHRHRVAAYDALPIYTTWAHNGAHHSHRMPDGGWTRPRVDQRPPDAPRRTLDEFPVSERTTTAGK